MEEGAEQKLAHSVDEFCALIGISRRKFYGMLKNGEGPATMTVGRRRLVRAETAQEWLREREKVAA